MFFFFVKLTTAKTRVSSAGLIQIPKDSLFEKVVEHEKARGS